MFSRPFVIAVFAMVAAASAVIAVANALLERQQRKQALAKLGAYEWTDERQAVLAEGWKTRLGAPLLAVATARVRRFTPTGYRDKAARKLAIAGMSGEDQLDRYIAAQVGAAVAALPLALIVLGAFGRNMTGYMAAGFMILLCAIGPSTIVNRRAEARQKDIVKTLPDVLDLLVISVEAGLGFEQAIDRTVAAVPGALTDEFARMIGEVRAGARRADALRALSIRIDNEDVRGFVMAVLQADTFGVSIGRMLRQQADEIRVRRRQAAQEKAQKAPVKMLIPMVFCIFPAILVVIIGPSVINIMRTLAA